MAALAGKKCDFYVTAGASVPMTNEAMTDIAAAGYPARTTYAVTNAVKRYFDPATALVIQQSLDSGGSWNPVTPDLVQAGLIQFVTPRQLSPLAQLRVSSGSYLPYARVGGGHEWGLNPAVAILESTEFMQTSKHHVSTSTDEGTFAVKRYWLDDTMRAVLGGRMVVIAFLDATTQPAGPRYEFLAMLKDAPHKQPVVGLIEEDLNFEIDGDVSFLAA